MDVRVATSKAISYFQDIRRPLLVDGVRVEEVEQSVDGKNWLVTISYLEEDPRPGWLAALSPLPREYRVLEVEQEDGAVLSMKLKR